LESLNHFTVPVAITSYLYEKPRESGRDEAGHEESRVGMHCHYERCTGGGDEGSAISLLEKHPAAQIVASFSGARAWPQVAPRLVSNLLGARITMSG
jgi:hypothetical protein